MSLISLRSPKTLTKPSGRSRVICNITSVPVRLGFLGQSSSYILDLHTIETIVMDEPSFNEPVISGPFELCGGSLTVEFLKPHPSRNASSVPLKTMNAYTKCIREAHS